jgi:hypothetical protein
MPHPHQAVQVAFETMMGSDGGSAAGSADATTVSGASWRVLAEGAHAAHHVRQDWREVGALALAVIHLTQDLH